MRALRWALFRQVLALLFVAAPLAPVAPANAQVGVSASAASDYLYRGVSLSDGKPALSVSIAYDRQSGGYVGGALIGEETADAGPRRLGDVEYLGYARRINANTTLDGGLYRIEYTNYNYQRYSAYNNEVYAGLKHGPISYYIYYSPHYFGRSSTVYLDMKGALRLARHWRLSGHVGVLTQLKGGDASPVKGVTYDLRTGLAAEFKGGEVELAWTTRGPDASERAGRPRKRDAIVLGASCFF